MATSDDDFVALYWPDHHSELSTLSRRELRARRLLSRVFDAENAPPAAPHYSAEEHRELDHWRKQVMALIEARLFSFRDPLSLPKEYRQASRMTSFCKGNLTMTSRTEHRALRIPEILDAILRQSNLRDVHTAWSISRAWRASARAVIENRSGCQTFWDQSRVGPVEYARRIAPDQPPRELIQDEVSQLQQELPDLLVLTDQEPLRSYKSLYFPARITQAAALPRNLISQLDVLDQRQHPDPLNPPPKPLPASRHPNLYWLDFSQFELNPHLDVLFEKRLSVVRGKCEIALRPSSSGLSTFIEPNVSLFCLGLIEDMHIAQPPCRVVGIYHINSARKRTSDQSCHPSNFELLVRLKEDHGIRVGHLLKALQQYSRKVLTSWMEQVVALKEKARTGDWIDDMYMESSRLSQNLPAS